MKKSENVYVIGTGMTRFSESPQQSIQRLTHEAIFNAVTDIGVNVIADITKVFFAECLSDELGKQTTGILRSAGLKDANVEFVNEACASGAVAFAKAVEHIEAGQGHIALAIGVEQLDHDRDSPVFDHFARAYGLPAAITGEGKIGLQTHEAFDAYATEAESFLYDVSDAESGLVRVTKKNIRNAVRNPFARYSKSEIVFIVNEYEMRVWDYLTLHMCAPETGGAAAAIVCSDEGLQKLKLAAERAVKVLACSTRGSQAGSQITATQEAAKVAYEKSGFGPMDISVAEVNDITAISEIVQTERLGFFREGEGCSAADKGVTEIGGRMPINTSGGLLARGHALAATGLAQVSEIVSQLRGECGRRQVQEARVGLAQMSSGLRFADDTLSCVTILSR